MLNHLDNYFFSLNEPHRSCLLFLRHFILDHAAGLSEQWNLTRPFTIIRVNGFVTSLTIKKQKNLHRFYFRA